MLWLHSVHHHQSRQDVNYSMRVTGAFKDPLDRQIMERIQNFKGPVLMNRRSEMGGVRVERMQYRSGESELGSSSFHLQPYRLPGRETLSSRAGATVFIPIFLPFGDQDLAFGPSIG